MSLEAIPLEIIVPAITAAFGSYLLYVTAMNKNKNDKKLKEKELSGASWEPLVSQMQAFFEKQKEYLLEEIEDLRVEMQLGNAYRHDVTEQIRVFRAWAREHGYSKDIPKIETYDEWFVRHSNTKGKS